MVGDLATRLLRRTGKEKLAASIAPRWEEGVQIGRYDILFLFG